MHTITELLNEASWKDASSAYEDIRKHPDKWVHFTNVNKFGVNPRKDHLDAYGIYGYPNSWLTRTGTDLTLQYGTNHAYYYIYGVKPGTRLLNLSTVTYEEALGIVKRCGGDASEMDGLKKVESATVYPKVYRYVRSKVRKGECTWKKAFHGYDGIIDDGEGIIHHQEPYQMVLFDTRNAVVLAHGANRIKHTEANREIARGICHHYGCSVEPYFRHGIIHFTLNVEGVPVNARIRRSGDVVDLFYAKDGLPVWDTINIMDTGKLPYSDAVEKLVGMLDVYFKENTPSALDSRFPASAEDIYGYITKHFGVGQHTAHIKGNGNLEISIDSILRITLTCGLHIATSTLYVKQGSSSSAYYALGKSFDTYLSGSVGYYLESRTLDIISVLRTFEEEYRKKMHSVFQNPEEYSEYIRKIFNTQ